MYLDELVHPVKNGIAKVKLQCIQQQIDKIAAASPLKHREMRRQVNQANILKFSTGGCWDSCQLAC
jgi:hypothetical protein